jgi:RNA polymerase sigma factor (sigma-70 family)
VDGPRTTELAGEAYRETRAARERHAELFERITARIYRYFAKQVWDAHEAEELAQRTLLELERSLRERSYDPARSFNAWMWLKAHTVFAQWCRDRARRRAALEGGPTAAATLTNATDAVDARLDAEKVLREIQSRLGEETYEVLVLVYEGGLTQAEVADAIGRDRKTIAARLREARDLAQKLLDPRPPGGPS